MRRLPNEPAESRPACTVTGVAAWNRNTTGGPATPAAPAWMCAAVAWVRFRTSTRNAVSSPSMITVAVPDASVVSAAPVSAASNRSPPPSQAPAAARAATSTSVLLLVPSLV
ncbi:MAG TPA: hypothetical protein VF142_11670 [Longimicrobium sp.]